MQKSRHFRSFRSFAYVVFCSLLAQGTLGLYGCGGDGETDSPPVNPGSDAASDVRMDTTPSDTKPDSPVVQPDVSSQLPEFNEKLSLSGLYSDFSKREISSLFQAYTPAYELWSDGSTKKRYLYLPPNSKIDSSDMNHWKFPVGTRLYKEFTRDGKLVETRLMMKTGPAPKDWLMGSYVWLPDQSDAIWNVEGDQNVNGTPHDVPSVAQCNLCHSGEADRVLGVQAIQMAKPGIPFGLSQLTQANLLSNPPPSDANYTVPGTPTEEKAFGYLHANCGHCHNPASFSAGGYTLNLRLDVPGTDRDPKLTNVYKTSVGVANQLFAALPFRVELGHPEKSSVAVRMAVRGPGQMPQVGTEVVDQQGVDSVRAWIGVADGGSADVLPDVPLVPDTPVTDGPIVLFDVIATDGTTFVDAVVVDSVVDGPLDSTMTDSPVVKDVSSDASDAIVKDSSSDAGDAGGTVCRPIINEVQIRGSSYSSGWSDEFVELYNPCSSNYTFASGDKVMAMEDGNPGFYYLIQELSGRTLNAGQYWLFVNSKWTGTSSLITSYFNRLPGQAGEVEAYNYFSADGAAGWGNITGSTMVVYDAVAWQNGATTGLVEGTALSDIHDRGKSFSRKPNGKDTNNNAADFSRTTNPTPKAAN